MKTDMYDKTGHHGIIFEIMDRGGPTDDRESYVEDAVAEITRSRSRHKGMGIRSG